MPALSRGDAVRRPVVRFCRPRLSCAAMRPKWKRSLLAICRMGAFVDSDLLPIDFDKASQSDAYGFTGFLTVAQMRAAQATRGYDDLWSVVSGIPGVYLVLRQSAGPPHFLERGTGGFFQGEDPNVALSVLADAWIPEARVLYISKTHRPLRDRL